MANKVTGSTDTTGAVSVAQTADKSVLLVGQISGAVTEITVANTIFSITGTADVKARFGADSIMAEVVKVLITNGVDYIKGMIAAPTTAQLLIADSFEDAFDASLVDSDIKCIVLDNMDSTVITKLKTHLTTAESNDMFRYSCMAPATGADSQTTLLALATTVSHKRIFICGPTLYKDDAVTVASPVVAAAGIASLLMTETIDPALPMNGVSILGFGGVTRSMLNSEKNALAAGGIVPLYNEGGYPTVYRLVTSDVSANTVWKEGSTLMIADYVLETVENTLRINFKRTKNVVRIIDAIKTSVKTVLENCVALEIIDSFDSLSVVKDSTDAYGALVDYEFDVVTPLYTITITQHMKI